MSDLPADTNESLNIRDVLARIDRQQAETRKFVAEQAKLSAEQSKLVAEQVKLMAEASKLSRDRFLAPAIALAATLGAIATLVPLVLRATGR